MKQEPNDLLIEEAVARLYLAFYRMRKAGQYQEEYDAMGTIVSMLSADRQHLREKYKVIV